MLFAHLQCDKITVLILKFPGGDGDYKLSKLLLSLYRILIKKISS